MPKNKLFDEDSEEDLCIKTENEYAKKYDKWREKEEIHKLEQKYGPDALNSERSGSSDSEDESDVSLEVNEEKEAQFLKTLALLKTRDPRIYDPNFKCFYEDEEKQPEKETKSKMLTFDDSEDDDDQDGDIFKIEKKAEIDDADDLIKTKGGATNNSKNNKEGKIKDYLTGQVEYIDDNVEKDLAPLKALWSDPKLNEGEAFLRDYILNKRYLDDGDTGEVEEKVRDDAELEADERTVEEQSKFERAYNFRFEEPDEEYLKRFPRTINYIRPKDERRKRKRAELRTRKEEEKKRKMEEIARLKALKLKEIQDKIARIKEVTGNQELAFKEEDIEGDFDPEEHDRRMRALFDEEYYGEADHTKPTFPNLDEELEIENWDNYEVENEKADPNVNDDGPHCEDDDFNMDADYDPRKSKKNLLEEIQKTLGKKRRNRKRQTKLSQLLATEKPKFLPLAADRTYAEHMEEYYQLDCEDIVGGMPTRFKYREVVPNDYGLTVEEILLADDKELTQWVPLKRIVKHRGVAAEKADVATYRQRASDQNLKKRLLPSLFRHLPGDPEIAVPVQETKKKKKKNKHKNVETGENIEPECEVEPENNFNSDNGENATNENIEEMNTKKKKKSKHDRKISGDCPVDSETNEGDLEHTNKDKTKKSKRKHKLEAEAEMSNENPTNENNDSEKITKNKKSKIKKKSKDEDKLNIPNDDIVSEQNTNSETVKSKKSKRKNKLNNSVASDTFNNSQTNETEVLQNGVEEKEIIQTDSNKMSKQKFKNQQNNKRKEKTIDEKRNKKNKFKNKKKFKSKQSTNSSDDNPLGKLSDERLKAYGLNPKKYRGFLKYKKF